MMIMQFASIDDLSIYFYVLNLNAQYQPGMRLVGKSEDESCGICNKDSELLFL